VQNLSKQDCFNQWTTDGAVQTLVSPSVHSTTVEPSKTFVLPSGKCLGMLMKGSIVLHSHVHPHVACTIQDMPHPMHWTIFPYSSHLSPCHFRMKMMVYWDVALCILIEIDQCFRGTYCLHHKDDYGGS
jgi:hypothetical protein